MKTQLVISCLCSVMVSGLAYGADGDWTRESGGGSANQDLFRTLGGKRFTRDKSGMDRIKKDIGLHPAADLSLDREYNVDGDKISRYRVTHKGLDVQGAEVVLHSDGRGVKAAVRSLKPQFDFGPLEPGVSLTPAEILAKAVKLLGKLPPLSSDPAREAYFLAGLGERKYYFNPSLVYVFDTEADAYALAYRVDLYTAGNPMQGFSVFMDPSTGGLIDSRPLIMQDIGTAVTLYDGTREINTTHGTNSYTLKDDRGNLEAVLNLAAVSNPTNTWTTNSAAASALWEGYYTYQFYQSKFGRQGWNNANPYLRFNINTSFINNAQWNGSYIDIGYWTATNRVLAALDILGHEYTHAVTQATSNLNYSGESGALNEGFSDIFGTAVEFFARGPSGANWLMGEDPIPGGLRSMSDPKSLGAYPNYYKGVNWYTGTDQNALVHINSSVLNYWFYLVANGATGTNEKGAAFQVHGIGVDEASRIAYRTLTTYLTSASTYNDTRNASLNAARDLYGSASSEYAAVMNAWNAVGIGTAYSGPVTVRFLASIL